MRPYGRFADHKPSPGPPQPEAVADDDPAADAARERVASIVAAIQQDALRGQHDDIDRAELLRRVYRHTSDAPEYLRAIIASEGKRAVAGVYDHLSRDAMLNVVGIKIKHDR